MRERRSLPLPVPYPHRNRTRPARAHRHLRGARDPESRAVLFSRPGYESLRWSQWIDERAAGRGTAARGPARGSSKALPLRSLPVPEYVASHVFAPANFEFNATTTVKIQFVPDDYLQSYLEAGFTVRADRAARATLVEEGNSTSAT